MCKCNTIWYRATRLGNSRVTEQTKTSKIRRKNGNNQFPLRIAIFSITEQWVCELMRRRILCSRLCGVLEFPQRARGSEEGVAWHPLQKIVYNKIRLFNDETQYIKKFILLILFWKCDILSMRTNTNIFWTYQTKGEVYPYRTIDLYMEKMQIPIDRCDVFVFIVFVRANRDLRFSCADLG